MEYTKPEIGLFKGKIRILLVDDERIALLGLEKTVASVLPDSEIRAAISAEEALQALDTWQGQGTGDSASVAGPDIAFLDINIDSEDNAGGIRLAKEILRRNNDCNIIFTTGYSEYKPEALDLRASGYIMKPVTVEKVRREVGDLRRPLPVQSDTKLEVRAFGSFEVFADGEEVPFHYAKTKELLAYLVDKQGAFCSNAMIVYTLWGEEQDSSSKNSYLRNLRQDLIHSLEERGCGDVIISRRGMCAVAVDRISCDYFDLLAGVSGAADAYRGSYMRQYKWAAETNEQLKEKYLRR
ncbi:MAG: response regulator [Eubacterium sp.]|nr:response regulator [Eubacterium sp.]